ncbi:protein-L-isoaspartate(D-aspartate) O-methyltransferase [Streptomyces bauhiniae]|uniref:Protein-L-isoaspartate O-methyltransferase n=1 Tax=Streptomyces bauhiniae TaxID=2340725 RepID=A0A4Z1CUN6_9ACTN|nr:protein-L-isoaspartate(D-aspartate) O-methyltransferase [Streptomyces bauhiniae]TGN72509.1 protein-L-isoaspartate(D-aspartate) O-methyltransferase [Streptomyces bauhiniae]
MQVDWKPYAAGLAAEATHPNSFWWDSVSEVPRHLLVPRWYTQEAGRWMCVDGPADEEAWVKAAFADSTLVTRVGPTHADHARADRPAVGRPTSSSTLPSLVVAMMEHARVAPGDRVMDLATGSGYSAALGCHLLGDELVTTMDVDAYLTEVAAERLDFLGYHPQVITGDATGPLPSVFDRIVSMVSVPRIPASWLLALPAGGRLVTTIAGTGLIIAADKTRDGGATGRVEWDRAAFMATRTGSDYPGLLDGVFATAGEDEGEVRLSPFPVLDVMRAWEVWSMLTLAAPGIEHRTGTSDDGSRMTWMLHPDGSWARARTAHGEHTTTVHQGGPRRLYDLLDDIRQRWLERGELPVYGAAVAITPEGETTLSRDGWSATF